MGTETVMGLTRWYKAYCHYHHDDGSGPFEGNWYDNEAQAEAERYDHDRLSPRGFLVRAPHLEGPDAG